MKLKIVEQNIFALSKVDRENMVIRDVAVLGEKSTNNRRYTERAMNDAVRVFENAKAFLAHSTKERKLSELLGFFKNLRIAENKVRGDFHLVDEGELGKKILRIAETNPNLAGFSIDAIGETRQEGGKTIVESINQGNSVDLVLDPATVQGLFEEVENEEIKEEVNLMPYPNEHACRIREPDDFEKGSFRRMTRESGNKKYDVILGKLKGSDTLTEQAYRYDKTVWSVDSAKNHCQQHKGKTFEPAKTIKEENEQMSEAKKETERIRKSDDLSHLKEENQKLSSELRSLREELESTRLELFLEKELEKLPSQARTQEFCESLKKIKDKELISSLIEERKKILEQQKKTLNFSVVNNENNEETKLTEEEVKKALRQS